MKKIIFTICFYISINFMNAQITWYNPENAGFAIVQNQGWHNETRFSYHRLPARAQQEVREPVWKLSRQSAGLAIHFYSNAAEITIRYKVGGSLHMHHMPSTGVSGVDLYAIDSDGNWNYCSGSFAFRDTVFYRFSDIPKNTYHDYGYEYRLYLPLYNSVEWLEIGVNYDSCMEFIPASTEKPILVYGTSIAQGACASRPGMAWTNILQRKLDYPVINLGFSGNGMMEEELVNYLCEIDARLYILDCLPNLVKLEVDEITSRIVHAVKKIREKYTAPIVLEDHSGYSNIHTESFRSTDLEKTDRALQRVKEILQREGVENVYFSSRQDIPYMAERWVDNVHFNDLGMILKAKELEAVIKRLLNVRTGNTVVEQPVTQHREPYKYEWRKRHEEILAMNRATPPRSVIIGNSITHFWGGEPEGPVRSGADSWEKFMEPQGIRNLGYGWDRIENALWRVYHGELDGFDAEKVYLMIGTNNFGLNTDPEIVNGLRFLLSAIRDRQPSAELIVMGILPRRGAEEWVVNINRKISEMLKEERVVFRNPGEVLLQKDQKINESLFSDGLHPNEKGYRLIAKFFQ